MPDPTVTPNNRSAGPAPWSDVTNLRIRAYNLEQGAETPTLGNSTTIYANDAHQAIVCIEFTPVGPDNQPISHDDLPDVATVERAIQLLDYDTGLRIGVGAKAATLWSYGNRASIYACPLGSTSNDGVIGLRSKLEGNRYILYYYVKVTKRDVSPSPLKVGMRIAASKLGLPNQSRRFIDSKDGADHNASCQILVIDQTEIPIEALKSIAAPEAQKYYDMQGEYVKIYHIRNFLDFSDCPNNENFSYKNRLFRVGIVKDGDFPYAETQTEQKQSYIDSMDLTEPCCFLDESDGYYSYKGYLWPKGLVDYKDIDDHRPRPLNESSQYTLYAEACSPISIDLRKYFDVEKNDSFYCSIYIPFGDMVTFRKRQSFYRFTVKDQYGNSLSLSTNPANCPKIYENDAAGPTGPDKFASNVKWITPPLSGEIPASNWGSRNNIYFWIVSRLSDANNQQVMTHNYVFDERRGIEAPSEVSFRRVTDYDTMNIQAGSCYALREHVITSVGGRMQARFIAVDPGPGDIRDSFYVSYNDGSEKLNPFGNGPRQWPAWQVNPVWEHGGFMMLIGEGVGPGDFMGVGKLCYAPPGTDADNYYIYSTMDYQENCVFVALPAYQFRNDGSQNRSRFVQGTPDHRVDYPA